MINRESKIITKKRDLYRVDLIWFCLPIKNSKQIDSMMEPDELLIISIKEKHYNTPIN